MTSGNNIEGFLLIPDIYSIFLFLIFFTHPWSQDRLFFPNTLWDSQPWHHCQMELPFSLLFFILSSDCIVSFNLVIFDDFMSTYLDEVFTQSAVIWNCLNEDVNMKQKSRSGCQLAVSKPVSETRQQILDWPGSNGFRVLSQRAKQENITFGSRWIPIDPKPGNCDYSPR